MRKATFDNGIRLKEEFINKNQEKLISDCYSPVLTTGLIHCFM